MKPVNPFPLLLHAFFEQWLVEQRNYSAHTVRSYRDTWRLFLRFVSSRLNQPVAQLTLSQLTAAEVLAFLRHIEEDRKDSIGTRNCRLAALHSFFSFVAGRDPVAIAQCAEIIRIPTKRGVQCAPCWLDLHEVSAILAQPDRSKPEGQRIQILSVYAVKESGRPWQLNQRSAALIRLRHSRCQVEGLVQKFNSAFFVRLVEVREANQSIGCKLRRCATCQIDRGFDGRARHCLAPNDRESQQCNAD